MHGDALGSVIFDVLELQVVHIDAFAGDAGAEKVGQRAAAGPFPEEAFDAAHHQQVDVCPDTPRHSTVVSPEVVVAAKMRDSRKCGIVP